MPLRDHRCNLLTSRLSEVIANSVQPYMPLKEAATATATQASSSSNTVRSVLELPPFYIHVPIGVIDHRDFLLCHTCPSWVPLRWQIYIAESIPSEGFHAQPVPEGLPNSRYLISHWAAYIQMSKNVCYDLWRLLVTTPWSLAINAISK